MQTVPDMFDSLDRRVNTKVRYASANCYKHLDQYSGARLYE